MTCENLSQGPQLYRVVWTSEELGLKVPGEALAPYLDMMAAWLKLKLDEAAQSARSACFEHELTLAGEARVDNAATTDEAVKKRKVAAKALAKAGKVAKAHRLAEAEKARKAFEA